MPKRPGPAQQVHLLFLCRSAKALRQRDGPERPAPQRGERLSFPAGRFAVRLEPDSAAIQRRKAREPPPRGQPGAVIPQAQPPAAQPEADAPPALYVI